MYNRSRFSIARQMMVNMPWD